MRGSKQKLLLVCALVLFVGAQVMAIDLNPPPWRGDPGTTVSHWTYDEPAPGNDPELDAPDISSYVSHPLKDDPSNFLERAIDEGWINDPCIPPEYFEDNFAMQMWDDGYWVPTYMGMTGVLSEVSWAAWDIYNFWSYPTQPDKYIWIQLTYREEVPFTGIEFEYALETVVGEGGDSQSGELIPFEMIDLGGGWMLSNFMLTTAPNPSLEFISIYVMEDKAISIDQIVIDTLCYGEPPDEYDFGDAPDPAYPTLAASDGARHVADGTTFLGAKVDTELDGQPNGTATGDDILDGSDDEDGVAFTSLIIPGDPCATLDVVASVAGKLNAWLDFNDDGDWADPCEQIFTDTNLAAGTNNLSFDVPVSAKVGLTFARFRFDTAGGLSYTGQADNGEVEDCMVEIDSQQVCEPLWDGSSCKPATCGQQDDECRPVGVNFDPATADTTVLDCDCLDTADCHMYIPQAPDNPCTVSDNGSGTATLPPIGCQYECIPNQEQWMIIEGLPPSTTIELGGILKDFICDGNPTQNCSMPLAQDECETTGGSLGGDGHCFEATLQFNVKGTGSLAGFNRVLSVPVEGELHTAPRNPGDPVQMFSVNIVRLSGELFGDPDFCTLRVTAGTDSDLPSWGRTILTDLGFANLPGTACAVKPLHVRPKRRNVSPHA